jgi:tetratricopeptide (TPR) repeat protein
VSSWSNRFVSLTALAVLAGCHSTPRQPVHPAPAPVQAPAQAPVQAPSASAAAKAAAGSTTTAAVNPAAAGPIPERAAQQYSQALGMMRSGRSADAELELKQIALAYPQFAGPQLNLGLIYMHASRYSEAEGAFKAALAINPQNAVAYNELGIAQRKLGKFTDAEAAYEKTIAIDPAYAPAYLNLGVLYDLYLSQPQKALEEYEHYLTLAGDNKQVAGWVIELRKRVGAPAAPKKEPA